MCLHFPILQYIKENQVFGYSILGAIILHGYGDVSTSDFRFLYEIENIPYISQRQNCQNLNTVLGVDVVGQKRINERQICKSHKKSQNLREIDFRFFLGCFVVKF